MTYAAQQIAERMADTVFNLCWPPTPHGSQVDACYARDTVAQMSQALLDAGLREVVEALGIYVDLFGEDHAGDPARSALAALKGEKT